MTRDVCLLDGEVSLGVQRADRQEELKSRKWQLQPNRARRVTIYDINVTGQEKGRWKLMA